MRITERQGTSPPYTFRRGRGEFQAKAFVGNCGGSIWLYWSEVLTDNRPHRLGRCFPHTSPRGPP